MNLHGANLVRRTMDPLRITLIVIYLGVIPGLYGSDSLKINEFMSTNVNAVMLPDYSDFADWIEIYNQGDSPVELGLYFLTDDFSDPFKWKIPEELVIDAGSYVVIWATGPDHPDGAPFQLSDGGEQIGLFDMNGNPVDTVTFGEQIADISMGRYPDGGSQWYFYAEPTAGQSNRDPGMLSDLRTPDPIFSQTGGFYTGNQEILIEGTSGAKIHYTLDGSLPSTASPLYSEPLLLSGTTVIRARAYHDQMLPSQVITYSYIIDETSTLPVLSIATPPGYLFDEEVGITTGICVSDEHDAPPPFDFTANYWNKWERPIHIELYTEEGVAGLNQDAGIAIFGGFFGRQIRQKSFTLYAREKYGDTDFDFPLFPTKPVNAFRRFLIRASSNDFNRTFIRDAMMNTLVIGQMDVDYQAYQPSLVYINGSFWGLYNIREKTNHFYPESNYGIDADSVDLVEGIDQPAHGDITHYLEMKQYVQEHEMSLEENYEYIKTRMDITEFMNYFITELYVNNKDWIIQNIKCWREHTPDARWRWILYDMDWGFSNEEHWRFEEYMDPSIQWIRDMVPEAVLFHKLIENESFRTEFAQRFMTHLNLTFNPERVHRIIEEIAEKIFPEMPRQIERWGAIPSMEYWMEQLDILHQFAENRPFYLKTDLHESLLPGEMATLNIEVSNEKAGWISVFDTPCPVPFFSGEWYRDIPIQIEAHANPGWRFLRWEGSFPTVEARQVITLDKEAVIYAIFESVESPHIVISEIHYNPSSALQGPDEDYEFIELVNWETGQVDISGFQFIDGIEYTFPAGSIMAPGAYIILATNPDTYANEQVPVVQITDGRLNNAGEQITLADRDGNMIDQVFYDDHYPWPSEPDGEGPSLELIHPSLDNSLAGSWHRSSQIGGTPGTGSVNVNISESGPPLQGSMKVWPNPFSDELNILVVSPEMQRICLSVVNSWGQIVWDTEYQTGLGSDFLIQWRPEQLPAGLYSVRVQYGSHLLVRKIIHVQ